MADEDSPEWEQRGEAHEVLRLLALGLHPRTREPLPQSDVLNEPSVVRALFLAAEALRSSEEPADRKRDRPAKAGQPWTPDEDRKLHDEFAQRVPVHTIAAAHERRTSSILARLVRLKLVGTRMDARRILAH